MCPPASVSYAYGREEINLPHGRLKTLAALRHTDAGEFIICPMLCYSNGTDKIVQTVLARLSDQRAS